MGLLDFLKKKTKPQEQKKETMNDLELEKLQDSIDIYINFLRPRDNQLLYLWSKTSTAQNIDEEILSISELIDYYYKYKNECIAKGEYYYKHFTEMNTHNDNNVHPIEDIVRHEDRLKYIQNNYELLIKEQQERFANEIKRQELLQNIDLDKSLQDIILSNPGILQTEVYKKYDILLKDSVSEKLYFLAKDGKIKRVKSGRSYQLFWA